MRVIFVAMLFLVLSVQVSFGLTRYEWIAKGDSWLNKAESAYSLERARVYSKISIACYMRADLTGK